MVLTEQEVHRQVVFPFEEDRATTARVASFFSLLASSIFLGMPILFFGVGKMPYVWNSWLVGGLMVTVAACRLVWPRETTAFALINMAAGVWLILSPFVFGYVDRTPWLTVSVGCGAAILVLSYLSRLHSSRLLPTRSLASDNDAF